MQPHIIKEIIDKEKKSSPLCNLLKLFISRGASTIPELSKSMGVSLPTATKALNELMAKGIVKEVGKRDNSMGRVPTVYDLIPTSGYFIGIDPGISSLILGLSDFCGNIIDTKAVPFQHEDSPANFEKLAQIIEHYVDGLSIDKSKILNICMNVAGRVNPQVGSAYGYYTWMDEPLAQTMASKLGYPFSIDNDTRSMAYAEYVKGCSKGLKNVVFVNIGWGLGMSMIIDGKLYFGKSGYSGEFGHMHAYNNGVICHCGKIGCLETEVSGMALIKKLTKQLQDGRKSVLSDKVVGRKEELTLQDVLEAIAREDVLCVEALQNVADELGKSLAGIINIFNPEMLVIGGDLSVTGDYLTLPVSMGIKKYSLNVVNEDSQIVSSALKEKAGLIGACLMARYRLLV